MIPRKFREKKSKFKKKILLNVIAWLWIWASDVIMAWHEYFQKIYWSDKSFMKNLENFWIPKKSIFSNLENPKVGKIDFY